MAAANESSVTQVNILEGEAKELLLERYSDLKFVDDITDVKCKRCDRVLIYHYVANCGHLFCKNCRRVLSDGEGWRCPQCKEYVTSIEEQKLEVEERVYGLMVHCLNHKYGCKLIMPLRQIIKHLEVCEDPKEANLPMFYEGTHNMEAVMKRMGEMSEEMKQLREAIDQSQKQTEDRIFQKLCEVMREELLPSQTALESMLKQVENNQRRDVERMEQKMVSWNNNILIETTRAQTQTEDRCNLNTREVDNKISELEQQIDEMRINLCAVESKVVEQTKELSTEVQGLKADCSQTKDHISAEMTELQHQHKNVISGMEIKLNRRLNDLSEKLAETGIQLDLEDETERVASGQSSDSVKEYNILLLGPRGAGKSLLVNCIPNYLKYKTLDEALSGGDLMCPIPVRFTITGENFQPVVCELGQKSDNEEFAEGQLRNEDFRCYELKCGDFKIRLINSPGIGSTDGPEEDVPNTENILEAISRYDHLHAIAIVMEANKTQMTPLFKDRLNLIFTHLHKTAASNIIFILTHGNICDYKPLNFLPTFQMYLNELKQSYSSNLSIELDKHLIYCVDNVGYRYLVARLNGQHEIYGHQSCVSAWAKSANEIGCFLNDITRGSANNRFQPHLVRNTMAIYEARRLICIIDPILQHIISKTQANDQYLKSLIAIRYNLRVMETTVKIGSENGEYIWVCQSDKCKTSINLNGVSRVIHAQHCGEGFYSTGYFSSECSYCSCQKNEHAKMSGVCAYRQIIADKYDIGRVVADLHSDLVNMRSENLFIESAVETFQNFIAANALVVERTSDTEPIHSEELHPHIIYKMKRQLFDLSINGARIKAAYDDDVADRKIMLDNISDRTTVVEGVFNLAE